MLVQLGKKRKMEPVETVIVCGQQNFELQNQLNPVGIKIGDDQIINLLKKYRGTLYQFTLIGFLFLSSVTKDTHQIFVTCHELNRAKIALINGKISS